MPFMIRDVGRFLLRWWGPCSCLLVLLLATLLPSGCVRRGGESAAPEASPSPQERPAYDPGLVPEAAPLAEEPLVGVLLNAGARVSFTTLVPGSIAGHELAVGDHLAQAAGGDILLDGEAIGPDAQATLEGASALANFRAQVVPPTGPAQLLSLAGTPRLHRSPDGVELIEMVPLEGYLQGVLTSEMPASWPEAALEAQAIAARSYACAKYLLRRSAPWQLHWHYTVDMAYNGVHARHSPAADAALASSRGMILEYRGRPVPALFNACSGGRTEAASHLLSAAISSVPGMAAVMPVVSDPAAQPGAEALDMEPTHGHWQAELSFLDLSLCLRRWALEHPERHLPTATVVGVRITGRYTDSGRVASVQIIQRRSGRTITCTLSGADFRMACGPGMVRSTWWDRFTVVRHGIEISGRGFGHGVGLSQVSAWYLAHGGASAQDILSRFYIGADLVRAYP